MKRIQPFLTLLLLGSLLIGLGCKSDAGKDTPAATFIEFGNLPPALVDSLVKLGPKMQRIEIDLSKENTVTGDSGTTLFIPANGLLDAYGKPVSGKVILNLKEHFSASDFVMGNLQTTQGDTILQTQGMIYFEARSPGGDKLKIDPTKPIRIEIPVDRKVAEAKIFKGNRDENGLMNWGEVVEPSKYLVAYPMGFISKGKDDSECPDYYQIPANEISIYENTFVSTREFKKRLTWNCREDILRVYLANIDKELWQADEEVVRALIADSSQEVNSLLEMMKTKDFLLVPTDKPQKEAVAEYIAKRKEYIHSKILRWQRYAAEKLTNIDPVLRIGDTTAKEFSKAYVAYNALDFGWVNVDYFYQDSLAQNMKLLATVNVEPAIMELILPQKKVVLSGIRQTPLSYAFTKNDDGYNKLPKGEKAILIALGMKDNQLYFVKKEIILGQNETEQLELKPTKGSEVQAMLAFDASGKRSE